MDRFTKLSATGADLPQEAPEWSMVRDNNVYIQNGQPIHLIWSRWETAERHSQADAKKKIAEMTLGDFTDWTLGEVDEQQTTIDRSRFNPAVFTKYFETHGEWCWSATDDASDSEYAWVVNASDGNVLYGSRNGGGFARGVRRVPASQ